MVARPACVQPLQAIQLLVLCGQIRDEYICVQAVACHILEQVVSANVLRALSMHTPVCVYVYM